MVFGYEAGWTFFIASFSLFLDAFLYSPHASKNADPNGKYEGFDNIFSKIPHMKRFIGHSLITNSTLLTSYQAINAGFLLYPDGCA